jgi:hypothetical protein
MCIDTWIFATQNGSFNLVHGWGALVGWNAAAHKRKWQGCENWQEMRPKWVPLAVLVFRESINFEPSPIISTTVQTASFPRPAQAVAPEPVALDLAFRQRDPAVLTPRPVDNRLVERQNNGRDAPRHGKTKTFCMTDELFPEGPEMRRSITGI